MSTPLLENILNQASALHRIAEYQSREGRPALESAADIVRSKKRIVLSGMGASLFACLPFQYALAELGFQVSVIETGELLYFLDGMIDQETGLILVSRSGESIEVIKLLAMVRERGAIVTAIVNVAESALASGSDQAIVIGSPADQLVAIQTYTGTLAVLALLAAVVLDEWRKAQREFEQAIDVLSRWIPECVSASSHWKEFLDGTGPLYLLGRGSALGAVAEGVLLMHETAKRPAIGMSIAQFRHGPVEVTDTDFRGVIIGTQRSTAELDEALAQDLRKMGGQVRWIGPSATAEKTVPLVHWPDGMPERFVPIAEVVPLQMAAYRSAERRGVRPGDFRWAPLVTRSEAGFFTQR